MAWLTSLVSFFTSPEMLDILEKLVVATILSLVIGIERETVHKPAGIKTHLLICVSATLVMALGIYLFQEYPDRMDPSRLPAQILAGIGFVGAGTIIRDGFSVRGLTTAASLLAVTCIGLAVGAGYYEAAILATFFVFFALYFTAPIHQLITRNHKVVLFSITTKSAEDIIGTIDHFFTSHQAKVLSIKQIHDDASQYTLLKFSVKLTDLSQKETFVHQLCALPGVKEVYLSRKAYHTDVDAE